MSVKQFRQDLEWKDFLLGIYEQSFHLAEKELYRYVLDEVVRLTGSVIGFVHPLSEDQQSIIMTTWNDEAVKHCTAPYETHYPLAGAGNWVDCVHQKRPVVYNNFAQAPNRKGLPPGHNAIRRFMSVPVIEQGKIRVIIGVANKSEDYDDEDVFQTQLVANSLQSILKRRQAEKQLRKSEERLSLALHATQDGIWDWYISEERGYASPGYYKMLGYNPGEVSLNSGAWWRLIHPEDVRKVRRAIDHVMQIPPPDQENVSAVEFRMRKKAGDWCWILARGKVVARDDHGRPFRIVGTHTDITERKQSEVSLRESEERYRTLFETANDAILILDQSLKYVECNAKALEMSQWSQSGLLGRHPWDFCPILQPDGQDSRSKALAFINAALQGKPQKSYWRTLRKDGSILDLDVSLNALKLGDKDYLQVIARDITASIQAEQALRESEGKFKDLVEASIVGVYLIQEGLFKYVNAKFAEIFGYGMEEITDKMGPADLVFADDLPLVQENIDKRLSGETKHIHYGFRILTKSGELRYVEVYSSRTDYQGKTALIGMLLDVTEKKRVEESLSESEEIFRLLFEKSGDANLLMKDGRFIDCNNAALKVLGCSDKSQILNSTPAHISPEKQPDGAFSKEKAKEEIERALKSGTNRFDWVHQGFDGVPRYLDIVLAPILLKGEKLVYVTWRDITQRRKVEEDLLFMNALHSEMQNVSLDGILVVDREGKILSANRRFVEMWGIPDHIMATGSNEKALAFALPKLANPDEFLQRVKDLYEHREKKSQLELCLRNGRVFDMYSSPVEEPGGKYYGRIWFFRDITKRKRAEEALCQSESTLRSVFTVTPVGLCIMKDRAFQSANKAWYDLIGYSETDIIEHTTRMLYENEEEYERVGRELYGKLAESGLASVETRLRRKNGVVRDVVLTATSLETADFVNGRVVTIEDITERKRSEEALKYQNTLLATQQESSIDGILVVDEAGRIISYNRRFVELWCVPPEVIESRSDELALHSVLDKLSDPEGFLEKVSHLYAHPDETSRDEIPLRDGRTFDRYTAPVTDAEGRCYGRIWHYTDITDRKQAEEALRASEQRLNDVIEFLPDATLIIDREGRVLAWNRAMEVMTGVKKEEMLGKGDYEYALPFYGTRRPILIDLALRRDNAMEDRYTAMRRYDDVLFGEALTPNLPPGDIHLSATASVLRDSSGEVIAAIECIRDITERGRLEVQLRQAQKMEAIGTLAGGIAHDFNNILASMVGYTELAMMNNHLAERRENYLGQVMQACERAKNLVNQILSFSRQREQQKKPLDVRLIVKEALKLLRASLPSTIKINPQIAQESLTILADPTQIHQIVMNLGTNAAHAMREGGGVLDVYATHLFVSAELSAIHPDFKQGPYVHLMVRDSGRGIEAAILDKIFDPFFTTKSHQEGTGLGLSVVYGIVKSYDGVIQVQSEPGRGSTFNIYIPAIESVKKAEVSVPEQVVPKGREAILCVDDEEPLVMAMTEYLNNLGYDAVYATASADALAMIIKDLHRFDLIITDMTMPEMTGLKLSQKILSLNPDIPIILCTGYNETITEAEARKNGLKEFVLKPIRLQKVAQLVREVLDRPSRAG